jgi:hypothetical protein
MLATINLWVLILPLHVKLHDWFTVSCCSQPGEHSNDDLLVHLVISHSLNSLCCSNWRSDLVPFVLFNYPDIDWENWNTKGDNTNSHEYKFVETRQDNFLYQHTRKQQDGEFMLIVFVGMNLCSMSLKRVKKVDQLVSMLLVSLSTIYLAIWYF